VEMGRQQLVLLLIGRAELIGGDRGRPEELS